MRCSACCNRKPAPADNGTDIAALEEHCISVTPLRLDMTDEPYLTKLAALFD